MADKMSEAIEVKRLGGKATKNSGRSLYSKGDAILGDFTVDVKEYQNGYSINRKNWAKICSDAARNGGEPALMLALGAGRETVRLWVISDSMFKIMHEAYMEKYHD